MQWTSTRVLAIVFPPVSARANDHCLFRFVYLLCRSSLHICHYSACILSPTEWHVTVLVCSPRITRVAAWPPDLSLRSADAVSLLLS